MLQLIGAVLGFLGAVLLAIAYQATSDVHQAGGKPMASRWLVPGGLAAVALGFALQAAGIFCEVFQ